MTIKIRFFISYLEQFPENLEDVSDEGERFHEDKKVVKDRYQGHSDINMMADGCWGLEKRQNQQNFQKAQVRTCSVNFILQNIIFVSNTENIVDIS